MGVQLESLSQDPLQQYGPWHLHDSRFQQVQHVKLGAALLQAAVPVLNDRLQEISRGNKSLRQNPSESSNSTKPTKEQLTELLRPTRPEEKLPPSAKPCDLDEPPVEDVKAPWSALAFTCKMPKGPVLTFPLKEQPAPPRLILKRRRPDTDVDGFNTAPLSCKKRRLLRNFVTSRLSSPFSLPATHILNREGVTLGDKRFLRLAALAAARRMNGPGGPSQTALPPPPSPSSMMRRAAVMNSYRLRVCAEAGRGDNTSAPRMLDRALLEPSRGPMITVDARFPSSSFQPPAPPTPAVRISFQTSMSPVTRARIQARASTPGSPTGLRPVDTSGPRRRLSPSPRLRPLRSPELRTTRPLIDLEDLDALDDESVAFPTSEHESRYGDEPEEVYADFGVIFGGDCEASDDEGADQFEDYLDDVDGIPWNARC